MPNSSDIIGFTNPWYEEGFKYRKVEKVRDVEINIFPVSYFLATKLVALENRLSGPKGITIDWRWSQDFEDFVKVVYEIELFEQFGNYI